MSRKISATEERLREVQTKLRTWNGFIRELKVPGEFAPALATGRPELLALVRPRALTAEECGVMFEFVAGLIETNEALREHSHLVAQLARDAQLAFRGAEGQIERLAQYGKFETPEIEP